MLPPTPIEDETEEDDNEEEDKSKDDEVKDAGTQVQDVEYESKTV